MREKPNISEDHLRACLRDAYGLTVATLEFLPLGLDTRAGVYRVASEQGATYLLKAKSGLLYEPSCHVPRHLRDHGIAAAVAPLPTQSNALWATAGEWTVILYPFIDGVSGWNPDLTDGQWQALGAVLSQIHQIGLPPEGFAALREEKFDPSKYRQQIHELETVHLVADTDDAVTQALRAAWLANQAMIHQAMDTLETLAETLRSRSGPLVICHADVHQNNIIRGQDNQVYLIDWDDVMLAYKERDFLFVEDSQIDATTGQETSPFFQGYRPREIDWIALAYYRWERIVQDFIEDARIVVLQPDLEDATRAEALQRFRNALEADGRIAAARAKMKEA